MSRIAESHADVSVLATMTSHDDVSGSSSHPFPPLSASTNERAESHTEFPTKPLTTFTLSHPLFPRCCSGVRGREGEGNGPGGLLRLLGDVEMGDANVAVSHADVDFEGTTWDAAPLDAEGGRQLC